MRKGSLTVVMVALLLSALVAPWRSGGLAAFPLDHPFPGAPSRPHLTLPPRSTLDIELKPGAYRFEVRALDAEGRPGGDPAVLAFRVHEPLWRGSWTAPLAAFVLAGVVAGAHRRNNGRNGAEERLRRQIATDLHDDIGSGLTEIALLSEVARRDAPPASSGRMAAVAAQARGLRESMSDIVWAVDPGRDRLGDVVNRMREAAFNMAEADEIRVEFAVPSAETLARIDLAPDRKRHLLLAFREAMSNVVRHSGAGRVVVALNVDGQSLVLCVRDDGRGFVAEEATSGVGLGSLERRAFEVGGSLEIVSATGRGTTLRLVVPFGASRLAC